jgi:CRP/FNR family transcriptional regulator, anaerobic regulatory protein
LHQSLFNLISEKQWLTDTDKQLCLEYFEPVLIPKNRILEAAGKVPRYLYFVLSGFVRQFHYNGNGDEVTTHINCPPGFITSYTHFVQQTQSHENVEAITECELLRITKPDLDKITDESTALKNFSIFVFQQSLAYNEKRAIELATLSAEQRYRKLIHDYPGILHHVPIQYIASFLGMKPESLSRIRRQIIN